MARKGRVTIPTDESFVEGTKAIADLWGADAVRDCDGTSLPKNANELADEVYKTYFVVRGDNEWARKHPEEAPRAFLSSFKVTADSKIVKIDVQRGYHVDQVKPDLDNLSYWQVFDKTTGEEIKNYKVDGSVVTINDVAPFHPYVVYFLARITWHPTQVYNYLTNNWTCEKQLIYDPAYPYTAEYVKEYMKQWLEDNPTINVVRFTTFLYNFSLFFNEEGKETFVDWFGYGLACSPALLEKFKKEFGYELKAEDFVDGGCFNSPFRVPSKHYLDYMEFLQRFVTSIMRGLTDIVHKYNRKAMMFLGDDWIGSEPYGKYFKDMNIDSVVGSVGGGVTVRMLAEIPYVKVHEGRFLPYFFPDTFFEGNEDAAIAELNKNWRTARRALVKSPLDRMGFGGYLSLVNKFPRFVNRVTEVCEEFRNIADNAIGNEPETFLTVGVINAWGKIRSWQSHMVAHELWYQMIYSYQGILESLSGLPVKVKFVSFDDVINGGVDQDIDVLINVGDEGTAYSGGKYWNNPILISKIREWVAKGHGFIGVGEPTAFTHDDTCFALSDVLGVDMEKGFTLSTDKYNIQKKAHFITEDIKDNHIDYGEGKKNVYAFDGTDVLDIEFSDRFMRNVNVGEVKLAANQYFKGRGVYIAGLPYSPENARLLLRAIYWSANKEKDLYKAYADNVNVDVTYYPKNGTFAVINNSNLEQETKLFDINGKEHKLVLNANELRWIKF